LEHEKEGEHPGAAP